jgi:nitrous oxidase accessory protein NosD
LIDDIPVRSPWPISSLTIQKEHIHESSVYISDSKNVTLKNLSITNAGDGSGIRVANSKDVKIEDSSVKDFKSGNAIKITDSADIMIMNTKAHDYDHDSAIYLYNDKAVELKGVTAKSDDSNGLFSEFGKDYLSIIDSFFNYNDGYGILVSDMNGGFLSIMSKPISMMMAESRLRQS